MSFLKEMEHNGNVGHSSLLAFYADGDGDFHPKFSFNIDYRKVEFRNARCLKFVDSVYDAG